MSAYKICYFLVSIIFFSEGSTVTEIFSFRSHNVNRMEYTCVVKHNEVFAVNRSLVVEPLSRPWEGEDIKVSIGQ
jgi:hypothetical protein